MFRRVLTAVCIFLSTPARADIFSEHEGAKITIAAKQCSGKTCADWGFSFSLTKNGFAAPGMRTLRPKEVLQLDGGERLAFSVSGNTIKQEVMSSDGHVAVVAIQLSGSRCSASLQNYTGSKVTSCTIQKSKIKAAKDNPSACAAVRQAIKDIRALSPEEGKKATIRSALTCDKMTKVARSIKGAACASLFPDVDNALAQSSRYCPKPVPKLSEIGSRG